MPEFVNTQGERLHVMQAGSGQPLVLITGLGGRAMFWAPVMALLSSSHHVIAFDHPGVGASTSEGMPSITALAKTVIDVLDALDIAHAHILGHSTGGLVAQTLALDNADRVDSIILSGTWARPDGRFRDLFMFRRCLLQHMGTATHSILSRLMGYPSDWYELHYVMQNSTTMPVSPLPSAREIELQRIDMLLAFDRADELAAIHCPATVIGAQDDAIVPFHHSEDLAARIPDSNLVQLSGGHFFPQVVPRLYADVLKQHFQTSSEQT